MPVLNENSFEELLNSLSSIIQKDQGISISLNNQNIFNITKLKSIYSFQESKNLNAKQIEAKESANIPKDFHKHVMSDGGKH